MSSMPLETNPLLEVTDISKRFVSRAKTLQAVQSVSFSLQHGETLGIVGESGCGKSTLGRCILQLIRPDTGSVQLMGHELTTLSQKALRPHRQQLQLIFQNPYSSLNPKMSIGDCLAEPFIIHKIFQGKTAKTQRTEAVAALLEQVGLPADSIHRYPHQFSGGQRQRIGIARAMALNPKVIIADEPVSALDVSIQAQILNLLKSIQAQRHVSYLFIAHHLGVVRYMSHRVAVMYDGRIVELACADTLFSQPKHPYTRLLLESVTHPIATRPLEVETASSPSTPITGCAFHPRCPLASDLCRLESPPLQTFADGSQVACHEIITS